MGVSVCPAAEVSAPVESLWSLLRDPDRYAEWWDARTEAIEPPGSARPGQQIHASAVGLGRRWRILLEVERVDPERRQIALTVHLPLGIVSQNVLTASALTPSTSRLAFG